MKIWLLTKKHLKILTFTKPNLCNSNYIFSRSRTGREGILVGQQRVHHRESGGGPVCHHLRPVQRSVERSH